jgi:hypothetical protein
VVTLTDAGINNWIIADGIRLERIGSPLLADSPAIQSDQRTTPLSGEDVQSSFAQAISYWTSVDPQLAIGLQDVHVAVKDLPDSILGVGFEKSQTIWLDEDAAGYGWSLSPALGVDPATTSTRLDLLTVITHELGHVLGLPDLDASTRRNSVMTGTLPLGVGRIVLPGSESQQYLLPTTDDRAIDRLVALSGQWGLDSDVDRALATLDSNFDLLDRGGLSDELEVEHRQSRRSTIESRDSQLLRKGGRALDELLEEEDLLDNVYQTESDELWDLLAADQTPSDNVESQGGLPPGDK